MSVKGAHLCATCDEPTPSREVCPVCGDHVCSIPCMRKHAEREQKKFLSMSPYEQDMLIDRLEKEEEAKERSENLQRN